MLHELDPLQLWVWPSLIDLAEKLEMLARKQLRADAFTDEDDKFLVAYGDRLAELFGYRSHGGSWPSDNAMKVVDVFHCNARHNYQLLHVAIGRPRALYVLYPWQGGEYICRGAVLPYYEFLADEPLTDAEWRARLDSSQRPPLPGWLQPLYRP